VFERERERGFYLLINKSKINNKYHGFISWSNAANDDVGNSGGGRRCEE
jgi:hypothetical protein